MQKLNCFKNMHFISATNKTKKTLQNKRRTPGNGEDNCVAAVETG